MCFIFWYLEFLSTTKNATSKVRKKTNIFLTKANQLQLLSEQKQREKQTAKSQKQVHASILAGAY